MPIINLLLRSPATHTKGTVRGTVKSLTLLYCVPTQAPLVPCSRVPRFRERSRRQQRRKRSGPTAALHRVSYWCTRGEKGREERVCATSIVLRGESTEKKKKKKRAVCETLSGGRPREQLPTDEKPRRFPHPLAFASRTQTGQRGRSVYTPQPETTQARTRRNKTKKKGIPAWSDSRRFCAVSDMNMCFINCLL